MNASHKSPLVDSSLSAAGLSIFIRGMRRCRFDLEFFGDQIESLREFDIDTQTSVRDLRSIDILLNQGVGGTRSPSLIEDQSGNVRDYVRERDLIIRCRT